MPLYEYAGKHPEIPPGGEGIVRPLDVWRFDEEPGWGAWRELAAGEVEALTAGEPEAPGWRRELAPDEMPEVPKSGTENKNPDGGNAGQGHDDETKGA